MLLSWIIADASADTGWIYVRPLSPRLVKPQRIIHLPRNRGRGRPENSSILLEKLFRKDWHVDLGRGCDRPASNRWLPGRACGPAFGRGRPHLCFSKQILFILFFFKLTLSTCLASYGSQSFNIFEQNRRWGVHDRKRSPGGMFASSPSAFSWSLLTLNDRSAFI